MFLYGTRASRDFAHRSVEELIESGLDRARKGDSPGLQLAMDGIHQPANGSPVESQLPALRHAKTSAAAHTAVAKAMADGEMTPAEALEVLSCLKRVVGVVKDSAPDAWHYPIPMFVMERILHPKVEWMIEVLSRE